MKVFAKKRKKDADRLVGAYVPPQVCSYLTLHILAKEITKSSVVKKLMEDWAIKQNRVEPIETLVGVLIARAKCDLLSKKADNQSLSLLVYKRELKIELQNRGLAEEYIETILKGINYATET